MWMVWKRTRWKAMTLAPEDFRLALEAAFRNGGVPLPHLLGLDAVPGGSINQTFHLRTSEGDYFCKWNPHSPSGMFTRERQGLEALAASGTSQTTCTTSPSRSVPPSLLMES